MVVAEVEPGEWWVGAEALKLRLCGGDGSEVPRSIQIDLAPRKGTPGTVTFERPEMTLRQIESVLEPFLDQDFLYPRDSELTAVTSIFGPIQNALQAAGLEEGDIAGPGEARRDGAASGP